MLEFRQLAIDGVLEIRPPRFGDERGFFAEVWSAQAWREAGIEVDFVQDNHSRSSSAGVLRGLHYQLGPLAQDKLIRVARGRIFDVAVDLRPGSVTFGKWVGAELSASEWNQLFVPKGCAHGFLTLEPESEVLYKVSAPYSPAHERAIRFDDPDLAIAWPIAPEALILSDRDRAAPTLQQQISDLK
ncbi:MAG: dTDP-4-dehydrorhamnose 3,5-epimerase [Sphingomicrobium sp.]